MCCFLYLGWSQSQTHVNWICCVQLQHRMLTQAVVGIVGTHFSCSWPRQFLMHQLQYQSRGVLVLKLWNSRAENCRKTHQTATWLGDSEGRDCCWVELRKILRNRLHLNQSNINLKRERPWFGRNWSVISGRNMTKSHAKCIRSLLPPYRGHRTAFWWLWSGQLAMALGGLQEAGWWFIGKRWWWRQRDSLGMFGSTSLN